MVFPHLINKNIKPTTVPAHACGFDILHPSDGLTSASFNGKIIQHTTIGLVNIGELTWLKLRTTLYRISNAFFFLHNFTFHYHVMKV